LFSLLLLPDAGVHPDGSANEPEFGRTWWPEQRIHCNVLTAEATSLNRQTLLFTRLRE
jgi:hypothetical protein